MKQEFDEYIESYRSNCDKALRLSGESSAFFAEYKAKKLAEWLPEKVTQKSAKILDFGCGDGEMTNFVQQTFPNAKLYGTDPSPKSIEQAKNSFKNIQFSINSDENTSLCYESKTFDVIFSAGVFHHIPFEKHESYIRELIRIMRPGGSLVIFELNPLNPLTVLTFKRNPIDKYAKMMWPGYTKKLLKNHGKAVTKFYCFYPKIFKFLRFTEPYLTKFPLGALYATITQRA